MTMETYHWEKKHQSDPPITVSIMRALPEGNWTVRSEETTLPPDFPTRYDTLKAAMAAADEMARAHFRHDCAPRGCGEWMPLPPTHNVMPESRVAHSRRDAQDSHRRANQFMTIGWCLAGALAAAFVATRMRQA